LITVHFQEDYVVLAVFEYYDGWFERCIVRKKVCLFATLP